MTRFLAWLSVTLLLAVAPAYANGPFYVAPAAAQGGIGNDSNNCTSAGTPCATIAHASSLIVAPATVNVAPGTYPGGVATTATGTVSNPIVYQCTTRGACRIVPGVNDANSGTGWFNGNGTGSVRGDYVTIDGFELDASIFQGGTLWTFGIFSYGDHTTISHNLVHNMAQSATCSSQGGAALEVDGFYGAAAGTIDSNVVHDIGAVGCNTQQGIYLSGTSGTTVSNNLVYNINGGGLTPWHGASAAIIVNNTFIGTNIDTAGGGEWETGASSALRGVVSAGSNFIASSGTNASGQKVINLAANPATATNPVQVGWAVWDDNAGTATIPATATVASINSGTGCSSNCVVLSANLSGSMAAGHLIDFGPQPTGFVVSNNIVENCSVNGVACVGLHEFGAVAASACTYQTNIFYNNSGTSTLEGCGTESGTITSNPLLVDNQPNGGPSADYHLTSTSPGKVTGTHTSAPALDHDGVTRPNPPSIGAYEYVAANGIALMGPANFGSAQSAANGTPSSYQWGQVGIQGFGYLSDYGACVPIVNTNPGLGTLGQKTLCVNNVGNAVLYGSAGQKLQTWFENGSVAIGQYANVHSNQGATCTSNVTLPQAGAAGLVQSCRYVLATVSTGSASTNTLTADTKAAGATNCINMPFNSAGTFSYQANALDTTTPANVYGVTVGSGVYKIGASAATMAISGLATQAVTSSGTTTGAGFALTADTTNGCFHLAFTNPATSDVWSAGAYIDIIETPPQ